MNKIQYLWAFYPRTIGNVLHFCVVCLLGLLLLNMQSQAHEISAYLTPTPVATPMPAENIAKGF